MKNIFGIAENAIDKGIDIKWFQYEKDLKNQKDLQSLFRCSLIKPLNSKQVNEVKKSSSIVLLAYTLSKVNRESLVFSTNPELKEPPILFTADSNLDAREVEKAEFKEGMIITTPHHGSEHNHHAFKNIIQQLKENKVNEVSWVRGYHSSVSLGEYYLSSIRSFGRRYCTKCEGSPIVFETSKNKWMKKGLSTYADGCECK